MGDVCLMKKEQVDGNFFHYFRTKTRNTKKKDLRPIKVPLVTGSLEIINRWKNTDQGNPYLFPILMEGLTAKQIKYKTQDFIYFINKQMKKVGKELDISDRLGR
jgi:integrase/recombinase XerD